MRKQRWCGALLALALVLTLLPTAAFAADYGTAENPILISTADDLKDFRDRVNGTGSYYDNDADPTLCARLTADIVLNDGTFDENGTYTKGTSGKDAEKWTPIGGYDYYSDNEVLYTGTFDGGGHTIKGLYINSDQSNIGLFGIVKNATIQNLTVTGYVKGSITVGGIVGSVYNQSSITIRNCVNYSTVTGDSSGVGGLVGDANGSSTIQNCINLGNVTGKGHVGGLVGSFDRGSIQNCANLGGVKGSEDYAGGIVGFAVHSVTMTACYNVGMVEGNSHVGGLVGWTNNMSESPASNCYYLDTTAANAFGGSDGDTTGWKKSINDFTNNENNEGVLSLLRGSSTESPWADTCKPVTVGNTSMTLPWFAHPGNDTHRSDGAWHSNETEHWKECSDCGEYDKAAHSGGKNTCVAAAVCEVCGGSYGSINEANHSDLQHVPAVAATTTDEGNIEYWYCTGCCKYYKNAAATDKITQEDTVTAKLPSSTGTYIPSYTVSVEKAEHGSVTADRKAAYSGTTVTVTVTPDKGYALETLTVTDASGKELALTDQGDGRYTFTQPASKVTVRAAFMDDNAMLNFFVDVKSSDYFYDAVLWAAQKGITSGISDTAFGPDQPCTRAQIVTFLWRAAGSPEPARTSGFADVPADRYYAKAAAWAVEKGITNGTGDGRFRPDDPCTRAQAVTFLYRAAGSPEVSGGSAFPDVAETAYFADAVAWAAKSGITTGTNAAAFAPDDICTRAQIAVFLHRGYWNK